MTEQRTARSVQAYAQRARFALVLQVVVAALALASTVWFGYRIQHQNALLQDGIQAMAHVQRALQYLSAQRPLYREAVPELRAAEELLSSSLEAPRRSLLQLLAEAQFKSDNAGDAITTIERLQQLPHGEPEDGILLNIRLAKYSCAADDIDRARNLVIGEFAERHRALLLGEDGFSEACAALVEELEADPNGAASMPLAVAIDPAFKVRLVFLHIRQESERGTAIRIAEALCNEHGYSIPGIERIAPPRPYPRIGDLRYYHSEQEGEATRIGLSIERLMAEEGWRDTRLSVLPLVGFDGLPRDRVEVWLPERDTGPGVELAEERAPPRFACFPRRDAHRLVEQLNSTSREERLRAGELVANRVRSPDDTEILDALLDQLAMPRLAELSATGRLNVLYMLNLRPRWTDTLAIRLGRELDEIEAGSGQNAPIGAQTRDCIDRLREKLKGLPGRDSCGGL